MQRLQKKNLMNGLVSGLIAGLLFGIILAKIGRLPYIGAMIGLSNATLGFAFFLVLCAFLGLLFAFLCQKLVYNPVHGIVFGALYGVILWVIGPVTLIPVLRAKWLNHSSLESLGSNVNNFFNNSNLPTNDQIWSSVNLNAALHCLLYYVIFGALLGFLYALLRKLFSSRA